MKRKNPRAARAHARAADHTLPELQPLENRTLMSVDQSDTLTHYFEGSTSFNSPYVLTEPCPDTTADPVRLADGMPLITATDVASDGFGSRFGQTRTWADREGLGPNGNNWATRQMPRLVVDDYADVPPTIIDTVVVVDGGVNQRWFDRNSDGSYTPRLYVQDSFSAGTGEFTLTDADGNETKFYDFGTGLPAAQRGRFKGFKDSYGNQTQTNYDSNGNLTEVTRSSTSGTVTTKESFAYEYVDASLPNAGLILSITLRRKSWDTALSQTEVGTAYADVRRVDYSYYDGSSSGPWSYGNNHDLRTAAVQDPGTARAITTLAGSGTTATVSLTGHGYSVGDLVVISGASDPSFNGTFTVATVDSANQFTYTTNATLGDSATGAKVNKPLDVSYYRYYKGDTGSGYQGGLKFDVTPLSYARLDAAVADPLSAPDDDPTPGVADLATYADHYFEYDTNHRATLEVVQGAGCSTCTGGFGTYKYEYSKNPTDDTNLSSIDYNVWRRKVVEYLPDTTPTEWGDNDRKTYYLNEVGEVMLSVVTDVQALKHITMLSSSGNVATALVGSHGYSPGDVVTIQGATAGYSAYNGTFVIDTVPSSSSFTYTMASSPAGNYAGSIYVARSGAQSGEFRTFDSAGRVVTAAHASALSLPQYLPTLEANQDLLNNQSGNYQYVNDSAGLVETVDYAANTTATTTVAGDVAGYERDRVLRQGEFGTRKSIDSITRGGTGNLTATVWLTGHGYSAGDTVVISGASPSLFNGVFVISGVTSNTFTYTLPSDPGADDTGGYAEKGAVQSSNKYIAHTANGSTVYLVAKDTSYRNEGSGGLTTSYDYTWFTGTNRVQSVKMTLPTVSTNNNGPGNADIVWSFYDAFGRRTWSKDGDGYIGYTEYDPATGGVTKMITDVNTSLTPNEPSGWSTPAGGGLHLTTTMELDGLGRPTKATDPAGNVNYVVFNDANYEARSYPGWQSGTNTTTGPTVVVRQDRARSYTERIEMAATPASSGGRPTGAEAISSIQSLSRDYTNAAGQRVTSDRYFDLTGVTYSTAANLGTQNTNYYRTEYDYEARGWLKRVKNANGTVRRTLFDAMGRPVSEWVGTDDTPDSGFWPSSTTGTDLTKWRDYVYDNGGVGDGNLTQVTLYPGDGVSPNRVTQNFYDWRDRLAASKEGVEATESTSVNRPITYNEFDNLGHVTATEVYDGDGQSVTSTGGVPNKPSSGLRRARFEQAYDEQGRLFRDRSFNVDQSTGNLSTNALATEMTYSHTGRLIRLREPGGTVTEYQYDGAGRITRQFVGDGGGTTWGDATTPSGDWILQQTETSYDANGNPTAVVTRHRYHDTLILGDLTSPSHGATSHGIYSRSTYTVNYFDAADRLTATADAGTNGGSPYTRPSSAPARSSSILVTSYGYDAGGRKQSVTDPRGIVTQYAYDLAGRPTRSIEAYDAAVNSGNPTDSANRTTDYTYNGLDQLVTVKAVLPDGADVDTNPDVQTTTYAYDTRIANGHYVNANDYLRAIYYPDHTSGLSSTAVADSVAYVRNALGEASSRRDQNNTIMDLKGRDAVGRAVSEVAQTLGTGVDGAVRRIETSYDALGRVTFVTSYDATTGGNVVNQVQRDYNGLGQLKAEYQSHSGAVNTGTTPSVQYAYSEMAGGANHSRLTSITYPNGRLLNVNYSTGINASISRVSSLSETVNAVTTTLESYEYLGLATVVLRNRPQPGVNRTYLLGAGDGGDPYGGLDRFGRIQDERWSNASGVDKDRFAYTYDRDSNRTSKDVLGAGAPTNVDEAYFYDNLNRLTRVNRGTLATGTISDANANWYQSWTLDALGNWKAFNNNGAGQNRTHDQRNQITGGAGMFTPTYDSAGDMTGSETGKQFVYDAWGRLVQVKSSGGVLEVTYKYDGAGRRIVRDQVGGTVTHSYYSAQWQVLEEREGTATVAKAQYVWGIEHPDELVLRDRDVAANGDLGKTGSGLDERLYAQQDANWNVTSLVNTSGNVVERYRYTPYGSVAVLNGAADANAGVTDWSADADNTSDWAWAQLFQGAKFDTSSGMYHLRNRDFSPTLGRFNRPDPLQYEDGMNQYEFVGSAPVAGTDLSGLIHIVLIGPPGTCIGFGWNGVPIGGFCLPGPAPTPTPPSGGGGGGGGGGVIRPGGPRHCPPMYLWPANWPPPILMPALGFRPPQPPYRGGPMPPARPPIDPTMRMRRPQDPQPFNLISTTWCFGGLNPNMTLLPPPPPGYMYAAPPIMPPPPRPISDPKPPRPGALPTFPPVTPPGYIPMGGAATAAPGTYSAAPPWPVRSGGDVLSGVVRPRPRARPCQ